MTALNNKIDELFLGRLIGAGPTGVYYIGHQVAGLPSSELALPIARAMFPGLSSLAGDRARMQEAFLAGVEAMGLIALPAAFGAAFVAPDLVVALLGEKWRQAAIILQCYCPVTGLFALYAATQSYAMALGVTRPVFFRDLIFFIVRTPAFVLAAMHYGFYGAVYVGSAFALLHTALNVRLYGQISTGPALEPFWRARRSLLALIGMAAYFWLARPALPGLEDLPTLARLSIDVALGGAAFAAAQLALWTAEGRPDGAEAKLEKFAVDAYRKARGAI